jgi:hypothetical protein
MNGGTTRVSSGMVATAVEAILGAVDIDGGRDALARVMNHLGLTQHALLSWVKFYPPLPIIEQVAHNSLDLYRCLRSYRGIPL